MQKCDSHVEAALKAETAGIGAENYEDQLGRQLCRHCHEGNHAGHSGEPCREQISEGRCICLTGDLTGEETRRQIVMLYPWNTRFS